MQFTKINYDTGDVSKKIKEFFKKEKSLLKTIHFVSNTKFGELSKKEDREYRISVYGMGRTPEYFLEAFYKKLCETKKF